MMCLRSFNLLSFFTGANHAKFGYRLTITRVDLRMFFFQQSASNLTYPGALIACHITNLVHRKVTDKRVQQITYKQAFRKTTEKHKIFYLKIKKKDLNRTKQGIKYTMCSQTLQRCLCIS